MTQTLAGLEEEILRRIHSRTKMGEIGSKMSKAKMRARANELSELLGWLRGNIKKESTVNVPNPDGKTLGL